MTPCCRPTQRTLHGIAKQPGFDLATTYVHLDEDGAGRPIEVGADFWVKIHERPELGRGRLVVAHHMAADFAHWEMHPAGDELLFLLSGAVDMILQGAGPGGRERVVELRPKTACIVPRGTWHRGIVRTPGDMLFVTPGAGTQHRPL